MKNTQPLRSGQFELYDLRIVVEKIGGHCTCAMREGDCFYLKGGKLIRREDFEVIALPWQPASTSRFRGNIPWGGATKRPKLSIGTYVTKQ